MSTNRPTRHVSLVPVALLVLVAAACAGDDGDASSTSDGSETATVTGEVPAEAAAIMDGEQYESSRWLFYVADAETGEVLLSQRPDEVVFTASTAKNLTVGTVYDTLGPDTTLETPVYATTAVADGVVSGDVVLVASGDLAMGGRNATEGRFDNTFTATSLDHIAAGLAPNATRIGDPLAGVDDLAEQVAANGVTRIDGDVVIDTSLFEDFDPGAGPVTPMYVNDNLLDLEVTLGDNGEPATVTMTPETSAFTVEADVEIADDEDATGLAIVASPEDPTKLTVTGALTTGTSRLAVYPIGDSATWARHLFIEALERAGVSVAAPVDAPNDQSQLMESDSYPADQQLASLTSPSLGTMGNSILEMSYNPGANTFLCLLAVEAGSTDCLTGLDTIYDTAERAGLDTDELYLADGAGTDPASASSRQMSTWAQWSLQQSWGEQFADGLPKLGQTGSIAYYGLDGPSVGQVQAKAGTSVAGNPSTLRLYVKVQSLSGYLTLDDGRTAVFTLSMSGATYPDVYNGLIDSGRDVADVAAIFQQQLS
ncbi:D-alanyl-D-alanine carboxypeptidase/D-alanyl-D-alanine-endopeptidase [Ilumatobacter sp.]|uniref:D-alanyl-D-alanine carboxypeptidase/D-alanyl-D-alanine-endopeptidase n=1 Tax=Ilumatobacter sp. TaxID=1967498 RepID=UPI003C58B90D